MQQSFAYDDFGRKVSSAMACGPQPAQQVHRRQRARERDANGNLTYDGLRTYTWDALDQLIQVSGGGSSAPISYRYDDSGRRIAKATAGTQTLWTYDGQDIYAEYTDTWAVPSAVYTSGGATDDPVIRVATTGASSYGPALYYHADGLGTVVGLSYNQDSSTQLTVLDAWGVSLGGPPTPMAQYGYTGREPDEAGLVYMRARYYSPELGRFVSRDPAGLQGGINAYAYCGNNPTNCTDPSGLMPQSALSSFVDSSYFGMGTQGAGLSPSIGPSPANFFTDTTVGRALGSMAAPIALFTPNNVNPLTGYIENFNGDNRAAAAIGLMTLGIGAEVRGEGSAIKSLTATVEKDFFVGTKYTDKVLGQIKQGDFHAFPESVKGFQDAGQLSKLTGGDGVVRDMLKIPGEYGGKKACSNLSKKSMAT